MKKLLLITLLALSVTSCGHTDIQKACDVKVTNTDYTIAQKHQFIDIAVAAAKLGYARGCDFQHALDTSDDVTGLGIEDLTNEVYVVCTQGLGLQ